jgi:hypothetical protein
MKRHQLNPHRQRGETIFGTLIITGLVTVAFIFVLSYIAPHIAAMVSQNIGDAPAIAADHEPERYLCVIDSPSDGEIALAPGQPFVLREQTSGTERAFTLELSGDESASVTCAKHDRVSQL